FCQAREVDRIQDTDEKTHREKQLSIKWEDIQQIVQLAPASFYQALTSDLNECITWLQRIDQHLTLLCGDMSPSFSAIRNLLNDICDAICTVAKTKLEQSPQPLHSATTSVEAQNTFSTVSSQEGMLQSRQQALAQLREIARFFRQTEPHSPISYAVEKAIRWGELSLQELISELIPDDGARSTFSMMTGVRLESEVTE
ncbi:MAG TPA: hypothetical protein VFM46_04885, partial [Pseudomonadales bacterium]|nr:hypothetical protein [Pseudomonadales bacterium]